MSELVHLHSTLEQELLALTRGVSLECLVCGEFVMRRGPALACPECGSVVVLKEDFALRVDLSRSWGAAGGARRARGAPDSTTSTDKRRARCIVPSAASGRRGARLRRA